MVVNSVPSGALALIAGLLTALAALCMWRPAPRDIAARIPRPPRRVVHPGLAVVLTAMLAVSGMPPSVFGPGAPAESVENVQASDRTDLDVISRSSSDNAQLTDHNGNTEIIKSGSYVTPGGVGDIDDDGDLDAAFQDDLDNSLVYIDGNGNVGSITTDGVAKVGGVSDVDGEGDLDIAYQETNNGYVHFADANGNVINTSTSIDLGADLSADMADFDGDGDTDLAYYDSGNNIKIIDQNGTTSTVVSNSDMENVGGMGDVDDDGDIDIGYLHDNGNISFVDNAGNKIHTGDQTQGSDDLGGIADYDGDEDLDQVFEGSGGGNVKWVDKNGNVGDSGADPGSTIGGVGDIDGDGCGCIQDTSSDLSGQVVEQDSGDPVSNATVNIFGYEHANINTSQGELSEIKTKATNPEPPSWSDEKDRQLAGVLTRGEEPALFRQAVRKGWRYAAVHPASDWDLEGGPISTRIREADTVVAADPQLGTAGEPLRRVFAPDEWIVIHIRDTSKDAFPADNVDSDLPGVTTNGTVVVKRIGPLGNTTEEFTLGTAPYVHLDRLLVDKTHHAIPTKFAPGFYEIHPKGQPETSYMFVVAPDANTEKLTTWISQHWEQRLEEEKDRQQKYAQQIEDYINNNKLDNTSTTTNATGHWSINFSSSTVEEATIQAHKQPDGMSGDKTPQEIVDEYESRLETRVSRVTAGETSLLDFNSTDELQRVCDGQLQTVQDTGAGYEPTQPKTVDVPSDNVTVRMQKLNLPSNMGTVERLCAKLDLLGFLDDEPLVDSIPPYLEHLSNLSTDEIEQLHQQLTETIGADPDACRQVLQSRGITDTSDCTSGPGGMPEPTDDDGDGTGEYGPGDGGIPVDPPSSRDEVEQDVADMTAALNSLKNSLDPRGEVVDVTNGKATIEWTIQGTIIPNATSIYVDYSNGSSYFLDNDFTSVPGVDPEQVTYTKPQAPWDSTSEVRVEDFPVDHDDVAVTKFELKTATEERGQLGPDIGTGTSDPAGTNTSTNTDNNVNTGSDTVRVTNPTFDGTPPNLDAIRATTLQPGPDERVTIEAIPARGDNTTVQDVTVTAPNGSTIATTNVSNGAASFQTNGTGVYHARVKLTKGGVTWVEAIQVEARGVAIERPPSIRVAEGPTGRYAVAADGFTNGHFETARGGSSVTLAGVIDEQASAPATVHAYLQGVDTPLNHDVTVRVLRGDTEKTVRQRYHAKIHLGKLSNDAIVYRRGASDDQPLPFGERSQWGSVERQGNGTLITVLSGPDGAANVRVLNSPTFLQRLIYRVQLLAPVDLPGGAPSLALAPLPLPSLPDLPGIPTFPVAAGISLSFGGILAVRRGVIR